LSVADGALQADSGHHHRSAKIVNFDTETLILPSFFDAQKLARFLGGVKPK
jgi:hypothetical protein